jgi:phosphopantetheine adenylyltransferase
MRQLSDDQTAQNKAKIAFEEVKTRCTDLRNIINDKYKDEINQLKD